VVIPVIAVVLVVVLVGAVAAVVVVVVVVIDVVVVVAVVAAAAAYTIDAVIVYCSVCCKFISAVYWNAFSVWQWMVLVVDPLICRMIMDLVSHQEVCIYMVCQKIARNFAKL